MEQWWVPICEAILTGCAVIIAYGLKKLFAYIIERFKANDAEKEALQYLLEGIIKAEDEIVRDAKLKAADGKLTQEEIKQARELAWQHAKDVAVGPGKEVLMTWTVNRVDSLIKQLLTKVGK